MTVGIDPARVWGPPWGRIRPPRELAGVADHRGTSGLGRRRQHSRLGSVPRRLTASRWDVSRAHQGAYSGRHERGDNLGAPRGANGRRGRPVLEEEPHRRRLVRARGPQQDRAVPGGIQGRCCQDVARQKARPVPNNAGQLFRFVHEMEPGDVVVYPSKADRQIHIGRVEGSYRYDPQLESGYPNVRPVKWLKSVPRTQFSQGALYEIGSAMSLFQVKNYAEEFRAMLEGRAAPHPPPVEEDETVASVSEDVEDTTRDFIVNKLAQKLKGPCARALRGSLAGENGLPNASVARGAGRRRGHHRASR